MSGSIELEGLTEAEIRMIKEFVDFLKVRRKEEKKKAREEITFRSRPLKVKDKLTREEIYDYL